MKVEMQDPTIAAVVSAQQSSKVTPHLQTPSGGKAPAAVSDQVSLNNTTPSNNAAATIQRIGSLSDSLNAAAGAIRQTDQNLGSAKDLIDKMKGSLDQIIKNYPPFSPDSKGRQDILMSYASLRKEILRLTFPPPPPDSWDGVPISAEGKLATPDLTTQATYTDVTTAQQQLGGISGKISAAREQLGNSVKG